MNENSSLGETLRAARQKRRLSTSQVAEATRLKTTLIEDLERNDFSRVPAPIYGRGFLKLYAEAVGLDPHPLVAEYSRLYAVSRPVARILDPANAPQSQRPGARSMRRRNWLSLWDTFRRNLERVGADLTDRLRARKTASAYRVRRHRSLDERLSGIPWAAILVVAAVAVLVVFIVIGIGTLFTTARTTQPATRLKNTPARVAPSVPLRLAEEPPPPYSSTTPGAPASR